MPKHAPNVPKGTPSDRSDERIGLTEAFSPVGDGAHAGGFSYRGDNEDEYPDAIEALEPVDAPPLLFGDEAVPVGALEESIRRGAKGLLKDVSLFDIYRGPGVAIGKKSVAFNLVLRADDRSLTGEEADEDVQSILAALKADHNAVLR